MKLFTLIHINKNEQSISNNAFFIRNIEEQINLYFLCAKQLHSSLKSVGIELVVITNDEATLKSLNKDNYEISIVQIDFSINVPSGLKFYSAHFKIEVYAYLSTLPDDYIGLVDSDMICVNDMPESLKNLISYKIPLYYDITDQITPGFGEKRIISDKEKVSKTKSVGLWAGGEFICGTPAFFKEFYAEIAKVEAEYFKVSNLLHHQGDEVLTSAAIENMKLKDGFKIFDAGALSIIARFWSPKTLHVQKSIDAYNQHFLLHLPSDKSFITKLKQNELKGKVFFAKYRRHLFTSRILENTFKSIKPILKKIIKK